MGCQSFVKLGPTTPSTASAGPVMHAAEAQGWMHQLPPAVLAERQHVIQALARARAKKNEGKIITRLQVDTKSSVSGSSLHAASGSFTAQSSPTLSFPTSLAVKASAEAAWTAEDGAALYRTEGWGAPYFHVNESGNITVRPCGTEDGSDELDLVELVESLQKRNVQLPMIVRFPDIVRHRMRQLQGCFDSAIARYGYQKHYQGVFPVKSNHDRYLVEDIVEYGRQFKFGLEAGSKPELLIAMASLPRSEGALLICNGFKDRVYVESVLLARQLGVNAIVVLEQMEEVELVLETSARLGIQPVLGVRAKLSTRHGGHWGSTSGENGKFGLTTNEIVQIIYRLRKEGMLDCLQLLHFHIGSQIPSIAIIKEAMREASHLYCELSLMGAPMGYLDCGGGLGIDYDGTKSQSNASTNYSMQNYANDVVAALVDACHMKGVEQPVLVTESGRALASHQSVVVFDVLGATYRTERAAQHNLAVLARHATADLGLPASNGSHAAGEMAKAQSAQHNAGEYLLSTFHQVYSSIEQANFQEAYNDAKQFKAEAGALFKLGCLTLEQRAQADALYQAVSHKALQHAASEPSGTLPEELAALGRSMAAVYHINLSIFRSAPDTWAIEQVFPIVPLQRLHERPTMTATLADLTCDSDGKLHRFMGAPGKPAAALPVHEIHKGQPYLLGLFLGGVYQEVMGSLHNLFGATNVVHVRSRPAVASSSSSSSGALSKHRGGYSIEHVVRGQTMEDVLATVQHVGKDMMEKLRCEAEEAVVDGRLSLDDSQTLLQNYQKSLQSYTYLGK